MARYRGLTWDHPRGTTALRRAAEAVESTSFAIQWEAQPLEGFESESIAKLAEQYDLIVLDHPHLGDAVAANCLRPFDTVLPKQELERLSRESVGPSFRSYRYDGRQFALPLDAATQVSARRSDLLAPAPRTWSEVLALPPEVPVALSLAGPHAFLTFCSIAVAFGEEPRTDGGDPFVSREVGGRVLELMIDVARRAPAITASLNPIELLELMSSSTGLAYCPLVYGYVNYATDAREHPIAFGNAPAEFENGRPGSTIGGTGIAVSRRCEVTPELREHLRWLMSTPAQSTFIPQNEGQPSARGAWLDPAVNARVNGFYLATVDTIEESWVRPRSPGYVAVQRNASAVVREALSGAITVPAALGLIDELFRDVAAQQSVQPSAEQREGIFT